MLKLITGELGLLARLLYGTGMRINEALQLRVKDVDFAHQALIVRAGKGADVAAIACRPATRSTRRGTNDLDGRCGSR